MGDPAGVGPELAVRAATDPRWSNLCRFVIYGEQSILLEAARRYAHGELGEVISAGTLPFEELEIGRASGRCGKLAFDALTLAVQDALAGKVAAIVTAPMNKFSVNLAGIPFTGHTERIAELCGCDEVVMMQSSGKLRVAFVTTHIALAEVARQVTVERITFVTKELDKVCRQEGITHPRLAMAAINPHAGENGCMGSEDETVTKPAIAALQGQGIDVTGPFPPDTLFIDSIRDKFDGIISMYHDQGHIPFKMLAFNTGVNSTLGLPIIRTSPDHGTAFDIAWQGRADIGSFYAAIDAALRRIR